MSDVWAALLSFVVLVATIVSVTGAILLGVFLLWCVFAPPDDL